jgi:hypothetical protein
MPRTLSKAICLAIVMVAVARADTLTPNLDPFAVDAPRAGGASTVAPSNTGSPPSAMTGSAAAAPRCTIAVITENATTSDTYLSRLTFPAPAASAGAAPICPPSAAQAATERALDACKLRAANREDCVFADTDHMFDVSTDVVDSSALDSQCFSYTSKFIALACQAGSRQADCNVACGATAAAATAAARTRCHANHDGDCALINAVPVQAP